MISPLWILATSLCFTIPAVSHPYYPGAWRIGPLGTPYYAKYNMEDPIVTNAQSGDKDKAFCIIARPNTMNAFTENCLKFIADQGENPHPDIPKPPFPPPSKAKSKLGGLQPWIGPSKGAYPPRWWPGGLDVCGGTHALYLGDRHFHRGRPDNCRKHCERCMIEAYVQGADSAICYNYRDRVLNMDLECEMGLTLEDPFKAGTLEKKKRLVGDTAEYHGVESKVARLTKKPGSHWRTLAGAEVKDMVLVYDMGYEYLPDKAPSIEKLLGPKS